MVDSTSLILVALIPNPRDLEIARLLGWYRIPMRTAPKVISVDYLAFYQPSSFNEQKWRIEFISKVKGHELTTREELLQDEPEHPRAKEEYYKIQIGPIERLSSPIIAKKWKRLTFLYTTGEYLLSAKTINDLVVHDEERQLLWRSLRERMNYSLPELEHDNEFELDSETLAILLGIGDMSEPYSIED